MKALLINGSPRPNGCTFTALTELANTLEAEGIETEIVHVGNKDIRGCIACRRCHSTGSNKCVFNDIVNEVAPKLAEADAFVIGAPVYFGSPAGSAISFMDRLFFSCFCSAPKILSNGLQAILLLPAVFSTFLVDKQDRLHPILGTHFPILTDLD